MTELNWLKFSGLMHQCMYNRESPSCPFNDFRKQDNFQQLQSLTKIGNSLGMQMLSACNACKKHNKPIQNKDLIISNSKHFRIVS